MIGSLVDTGKDVDEVAGNEKIFYEDRKGPGKCHISEEIDSECAESKN